MQRRDFIKKASKFFSVAMIAPVAGRCNASIDNTSTGSEVYRPNDPQGASIPLSSLLPGQLGQVVASTDASELHNYVMRTYDDNMEVINFDTGKSWFDMSDFATAEVRVVPLESGELLILKML